MSRLLRPLEQTRTDLLFLRWLMFAAAMLVVAATAGSTPRGLIWLTVLVAGAGVIHLAPRFWLGQPRSEPVLLVSDLLLLTFVLAAGLGASPEYLAAFLASALAGALTSDLVRSGLAGFLVAVGYGTAAVLGRAGVGSSEPFVSLPLLMAAAPYFGCMVGRLAMRAEAAVTVHRQTQELRSLLDITDGVTKTLDVRRVMHLIVDRVGTQVEADRCSILLVDESHHTCFVVAASDNPDADMLEINLGNYPEIRKAVETREPVFIEDVEHDPLVEPVRRLLVDRGYRSLLVLPLVFGRDVLGTLFLRATRGRPFTPSELRFCKVAAGASANALKNALLYREVSLEAAKHRTTSEKLRRVLDCSPDIVLATDTAGRITEFNRGAELLTGLTGKQARGRPAVEILGEGVRETALGRETATGPASQELVMSRPGGERTEISLVSAPLIGEKGDAKGRVWIGRDVTHQRQVEHSLAQAERLSSVGELAAGVAHELNNPLSGVLGYAQLIQSATDDPRLSRDVDRIEASARRCQRIIHNLLSFARQHQTEKKFQNLNECVQRVLDLKSYHLRASHIEVVSEIDPTLPVTLFDFHQLEQVILNLLNNAEQAINETGRPGTVTLRTWREGGFVCLEVADDGPGVPEAVRNRIFDPFFTTKEGAKGTGLGLSVSYGIIQEHGGRIDLDSEERAGACFRIRLPLVAAPEPETSPPEPETPEAKGLFRGRRILVAEDEPVVCQLLARLLEEDGAVVTLAHDGQEAWEQLADAKFDLIVADLRMPNLDGRRLYEKVAAERPEMVSRFVFSTGDLVRQESLRFLERLPNRILAKPLDVETVRRVLHQALLAAA